MQIMTEAPAQLDHVFVVPASWLVCWIEVRHVRARSFNHQEHNNMNKYCLESPAALAGIAVLHQQSCSHLDLASLLASGRLSDLGNHADATSAAKALKAQLPYVCCGHCCEVAGPLMRIPAPIKLPLRL